jgi:hypothetical protein
LPLRRLEKQATISNYILASILDAPVVNDWQMLAENEGKRKKDGKQR